MSRELSCGEARDLASELLDQGLSTTEEDAVKQHVASCSTCPALYRAMVLVHDRLSALGREPDLPRSLADAVRLILDSAKGNLNSSGG